MAKRRRRLDREALRIDPAKLVATQREMARILGVSDAALRTWKLCPRREDKLYDIQAVIRWAVEREKSRAMTSRAALDSYRAQHERTKSELACERLKRARGESVPAAVAQAWCRNEAEAARAAVLPIAEATARQIASMGDPAAIAELLADRLDEAIEKLSVSNGAMIEIDEPADVLAVLDEPARPRRRGRPLGSPNKETARGR